MANLDRINFWSAVNVILMVIVGVTQVKNIRKISEYLEIIFRL